MSSWEGQNQTYLQCNKLPGLIESQPSYLNFRKAESGVLDSKIKFGLILHSFKGRNHFGGKGRKESYRGTPTGPWIRTHCEVNERVRAGGGEGQEAFQCQIQKPFCIQSAVQRTSVPFPHMNLHSDPGNRKALKRAFTPPVLCQQYAS